MTRTPIVVIACALAANAAAADPTLAHQGRLLDALGGPVSGAHTLRLALYDDATGGTQLHTEDFSLTILDGYYAVVLGEDTGNLITASDLAGDVWLEIILNPPAAPLGARQKLHDVPRAAIALDAAFGGAAGSSPSFGTSFGEGPNGASSADAALSCKAIKLGYPFAPTGIYWINPDAGAAFQAFCEMDSYGGGWTMVAKVYGADTNNLLFDAWRDNTTLGDTSDLDPANLADVLYDGYARVPGDRLMFYDATSYGCNYSGYLGASGSEADHVLALTQNILGGQSLWDYLAMPVVASTSFSSPNFSTHQLVRNGCSHPLNALSSGTHALAYQPQPDDSLFGINIQENGVKHRFTATPMGYDVGIGSTAAADGGYQVGDLDVRYDGTDNWNRHIVNVFIR